MTDLDDIREALAVPLCLAPLPRHACLCQHPAGHAGEHSGDQPPGVQMLRRAMVEVDRLTKAVGSFKTYAATIEREADKELDALRCVIGERDALRARLDATVTAVEVANAYGCRDDETPDEWAARLVRERDEARAQLAGLRTYLTRSIANDLGGMDEAGDILNNLPAQDRAMVDAWTLEMSEPTYWSKEVAELRAQLAEARATIARLNRGAH